MKDFEQAACTGGGPSGTPAKSVEYGQLWTRRQVAELLQTCVHTVARYTKNGLLPCVMINRRVIRYRAAVVETFIESAVSKTNSTKIYEPAANKKKLAPQQQPPVSHKAKGPVTHQDTIAKHVKHQVDANAKHLLMKTLPHPPHEKRDMS